jgi:hypothetical protein
MAETGSVPINNSRTTKNPENNLRKKNHLYCRE